MNDEFKELIGYLTDKFDFEPYCDDFTYETVEETIQNCYSALEDNELKDSYDSIKDTIKELAKYKDQNYNSMCGTGWCTCLPCMGYVIFDNKFKYVDFIIM